MEKVDGFLSHHKGDGSRYNRKHKRVEAMREMFNYINGNDLYSYSAGAIKNICAEDVTISEVTGESDSHYDPELDAIDIEDSGTL